MQLAHVFLSISVCFYFSVEKLTVFITQSVFLKIHRPVILMAYYINSTQNESSITIVFKYYNIQKKTEGKQPNGEHPETYRMSEQSEWGSEG